MQRRFFPHVAIVMVLSVVCGLLAMSRHSVAADDSPVFKTSVQVATFGVHSVKGADGNWYDNMWQWAPRLKFNLQGPLTGSQLSAEFFSVGNKPWVKYDCKTPELEAGQIGNIECGYGVSSREAKGTGEIGTFPFKIQMKNELQGTNVTIFSGRFNVKKFRSEPDLPVNKNHWEYYVDHDWDLPLGFVWYPRPSKTATGVDYYNDYAPLLTAFWFKGGTMTERDAAAYLFYQGKEISNTKSRGHTISEIADNTDEQDSPYNYQRVQFEFTYVFAFAQDHQAHPGYYLNENPGEYEVKVLRGGKLARALKFTVGPDGKIVDNGIARNNNILGSRFVAPAQVLGDTDGTCDKMAWKTEMFYGNPMTGFNAP